MRQNARARTITIPTGEWEVSPGAELTGKVRETTVAGGRVLMVEVDVRQAGRLSFYGDLLDDDDEQIGYVQRELDVDVGVQFVALPMVIDRSVAYRVFGLRVIRRT